MMSMRSRCSTMGGPRLAPRLAALGCLGALACGPRLSQLAPVEASPAQTESATVPTPTQTPAESARAVILVIADGTGIGAYTQGLYDIDNGDVRHSPFREFEAVGLVSTHPAAHTPVTDSAASATTMASGHKTTNGRIGQDPDGQRLEGFLERAEARGWATGIVATADLSHATPAAFTAHVGSRKQRDEIARQMADFGLEVAIGGGARRFAPHRSRLEAAGARVVSNGERTGLETLKSDPAPRLWALFAEGDLAPAPARTPSTRELSELALARLATHEHFALVIEESQVDWAGHQNDPKWLAAEMRSFHELVAALLRWQRQHPDILLVVTSDHETGAAAYRANKDHTVMGLHFANTEHSANLVPIWATGPGSQAFDGLIDNTEIGLALLRTINAAAVAGAKR